MNIIELQPERTGERCTLVHLTIDDDGESRAFDVPLDWNERLQCYTIDDERLWQFLMVDKGVNPNETFRLIFSVAAGQPVELPYRLRS